MNPTNVPIQKIGPAEERSAWKSRSNATSCGLVRTRTSLGKAAASACCTAAISAPGWAFTTPNSTGRAAELSALPVRRSEEHTSELQSHVNLVCRLLLEKKKHKH